MDIKVLKEKRRNIITVRYNVKSIGYLGIAKTIKLITRDFIQLGLQKDIESYIQNCDIYKKTKHKRYRLYELLQTLKILEKAQSIVILNFIVKLPKLRELLIETTYNLILVISDDLTKLLYFLLQKETTIAKELVYTYIRMIII